MLIQAIYLYNTNYTIHLILINHFQFLLKKNNGEATQKTFPILDLYKTTNQHNKTPVFAKTWYKPFTYTIQTIQFT